MSKIGQVEKDIRDIKDNHLPSIYKMVNKLGNRVWYALGALALLIPLVIAILAKIW